MGLAVPGSLPGGGVLGERSGTAPGLHGHLGDPLLWVPSGALAEWQEGSEPAGAWPPRSWTACAESCSFHPQGKTSLLKICRFLHGLGAGISRVKMQKGSYARSCRFPRPGLGQPL